MSHVAKHGGQCQPISLGFPFILVWVLGMLVFIACIVNAFASMIISFNSDIHYPSDWWLISDFLARLFLYLGLMAIVTMGLLLRNGLCAMLQRSNS
jgi:hypothetical protein